MAKTKAKKSEIYEQYNDLLGNYQTVVLLDMNSTKTSAIEAFKVQLANGASKYTLLKNTIFSKALKELKPEYEVGVLEGSTGAVFSQDDPAESLKKITAFLTENKNVLIKKGIVEGRVVDSDAVIEISKLPARLEMVAKTVGTIKSPISSFVHVLGGVQRNFLYTLKAIEAQKQ